MVSDSAAPQTGEQVVRRLARSSLVNMAGAYFMTGTFAVYLSTVLNFSTGEVAFIYGLGPFIGVVASVPAGRMVDRYSPRFLLVWGNFAFGVVTCAIPLFDSALPVAAALALSGLAMAWNGPARSVYIVDSVPSGEVQLARARVRRFVFLGSTVGTLMATGSLALDNDVSLTVAVLANGLTSVFVAVFVLRGLPDLPKNHKDAVPVRRSVPSATSDSSW